MVNAVPRKEILYDTEVFRFPRSKRIPIKSAEYISLEIMRIKIDCCGETHSFDWNVKTRTALLYDHPEMSDENIYKALVALGDSAPPCILINKHSNSLVKVYGNIDAPSGIIAVDVSLENNTPPYVPSVMDFSFFQKRENQNGK